MLTFSVRSSFSRAPLGRPLYGCSSTVGGKGHFAPWVLIGVGGSSAPLKLDLFGACSGCRVLPLRPCAAKEQFPTPQPPKEKEGPSAQRIPAHAPSVKVAIQDTQEDVLRRLRP